MDPIRQLPNTIYRLPTLCVNILSNKTIDTTNVDFFDENNNSIVSPTNVVTLFHEGLASRMCIVMPLSIHNEYVRETHCNAVIITQTTIERFEPRGNINLKSQSIQVQSLYDTNNMDMFVRKLIHNWIMDDIAPKHRMVQLAHRVYNTKPQHNLYRRYYKPLPNGIISSDVLTYCNASMCQKLVFNYVRIRTHKDNIQKYRKHAHEQWLQYEKNLL
jgi:hypothetical protein